MNLQEYIDELGGKIGAPEYLRGSLKDPDKLLVPHIILKPGESWTAEHRQQIVQMCRELTDRVIVRTSASADWDGMVDVMPTHICEGDQIAETVEAVRKRCRGQDIVGYAEGEGAIYDPDKVVVAVAPHLIPSNLDGTCGMVTEHPNLSGVVLVDVAESREDESMPDNRLWVSSCHDYVDGRIRESLFEEERRLASTADQAALLPSRIREAGGFPDTKTLQIEYVVDYRTNVAKIVQVREFSDVRRIEGSNYRALRQFGVLDQTIILPAAAGHFRNVFHDFERKNPDTPYILMPQTNTNPMAIGEQPLGMQGYAISTQSRSTMWHSNTRLAQMALRKANGVAILEGGMWKQPNMNDRIEINQNENGIRIKNLDDKGPRGFDRLPPIR